MTIREQRSSRSADQPTTATLVMLVKDQRVHLALAERAPLLVAPASLCAEQLSGGEVIGVVADEDLALLQDLTICVKCSARYLRELRGELSARVEGGPGATADPISVAERLFQSCQMPLL